MSNKTVFLQDNTSAYLFNAFTFNKNVVLSQKPSFKVNQITDGVILGDTPVTIANSNVLVYPLYEPKNPRTNYKYNNNVSALTMFLLDYIEPNGLDKDIPNYDMLKRYSLLQDSVMNKEYNSSIYEAYLRLTSYLHLYRFDTKQAELTSYCKGEEQNVAVDNYIDYTNSYIMKNVKQATIVHSDHFGNIAVRSADSNIQLITKALAQNNDVAVVHKNSFVMLCFNSKYKYKDEFTELLVNKYEEQGCFRTFFLNGVEPDAIVTAIGNLV